MNMASHFYFGLSHEEAMDPTKVGYAYALQNKDRWIQSDETGGFLAPGYNIGQDFFIIDDKVYFIKKTFTDIKKNTHLYLGVESVMGCDTRKKF